MTDIVAEEMYDVSLDAREDNNLIIQMPLFNNIRKQRDMLYHQLFNFVYRYQIITWLKVMYGVLFAKNCEVNGGNACMRFQI